MIYGYCRTDTKQQSVDRQIKSILNAHPKASIAVDWNQLMKEAKPGDAIVFASISAMSSSAEECFTIYKQLYDKSIKLEFLKEPHLNTETYRQALPQSAANAFVMKLAEKQIALAFELSEKEVQIRRERSIEGIETAKKNGKRIGREAGAKVETKKAKSCKRRMLRESKSFAGDLDDEVLRAKLGISRNTYYKYKRELKEDLGDFS
ncbi:MAG: recombinase family protein [Bacillota bacterium]|nr:recombinase family protein [Bacillota bacterium]